MVLPLIVLPLKFFVFSVVPKTSHMINKNIIALIPARGGSKSVPGKNIYPLAGKPLIAHSIETALKVGEIDRVIVSTDDDEIGDIAKKYGAEYYKRPPHLSTDNALVIDTIRELYRELLNEGEKPEIFILLEPTSPLRKSEDIVNCIRKLRGSNLDSVATFKEADLNPVRAWKIINGKPETYIQGVNPWKPRQELPAAYQLNGAVYAFYIDRLPEDGSTLLFGNSGAVTMPRERSVDIDDQLDFIFVESIMEYYNNGK